MATIPFVIGKPASGLADAKWAKSASAAKAGAVGELNTAAVLNRVAKEISGPTVIHDVRIPLPNVNANIDHLIVSGNTVTIIDSKSWKPGFYWTIGDRSFRGRESFPHANKKTIPMAVSALEKYAADANVELQIADPLLVVWSSRKYPKMRLTFLKATGAKAITGERFTKKVSRLFGREYANPELVALLLPLVSDTRLTPESVTRSTPSQSYIEEDSAQVVRKGSVKTFLDDEPVYND